MPSTIEPRRAVRFSSRARMPGASTRSDRVRRFTASVAMPACFCAASPSATVPSAAVGAWASGPPRPVQARQTATTATSATAATTRTRSRPPLTGPRPWCSGAWMGSCGWLMAGPPGPRRGGRGRSTRKASTVRSRASRRASVFVRSASTTRRTSVAPSRKAASAERRAASAGRTRSSSRRARRCCRSRAARTRMAASARARVTVASSSRSAARASASARATARPFRSKTGTVATRPTTAVSRPVVRL